jgi:hypothetical protein
MSRNKELDLQVKSLYEQVQQKKAALETAEKPNPYNTDGNFRYSKDGAIYNLLSVRHVDQLIDMLSFLVGKQQFHEAACKLAGIETKCLWLAVDVNVWQGDICTRITQLTMASKKAELAALEQDLLEIADPNMLKELRAKAAAERLSAIKIG